MQSSPTPTVLIEVTLLPSEAGGRKSPIPAGEYRGVLSVPEGNFSVRWFAPIGSALIPGGPSLVLSAQFLSPAEALPHFPAGASFNVWEGRIIGSGTVRRRGG